MTAYTNAHAKVFKTVLIVLISLNLAQNPGHPIVHNFYTIFHRNPIAVPTISLFKRIFWSGFIGLTIMNKKKGLGRRDGIGTEPDSITFDFAHSQKIIKTVLNSRRVYSIVSA